jgi:uncharacterized protein YjiS (DUF1127 family)
MMTIIKNLSRFLRKRARYKNTFNQLNSLSDRDLNDIGISRCDIHRIAMEDMAKKTNR